MRGLLNVDMNPVPGTPFASHLQIRIEPYEPPHFTNEDDQHLSSDEPAKALTPAPIRKRGRSATDAVAVGLVSAKKARTRRNGAKENKPVKIDCLLGDKQDGQICCPTGSDERHNSKAQYIT
jgi:hypothetical protein